MLLFGVRQYGVKIKRRACRLKFATVALFFFANSFKRPLLRRSVSDENPGERGQSLLLTLGLVLREGGVKRKQF